MDLKSTSTEYILINDCIKGNRKSQKELYELYSPKLFAISLKYAKDPALAEDILQDAFIKIFNNLDRYRGDGYFEGWLRRITVNAAIEALRSCRKNAHCSLDDTPSLTSKDPSAIDNLYEKDILKAFKSLSKGYREIFNLYAIQGYSHKEIADKFEVTESTSKSQYHRAKIALRDLVN